ncbi:MAG TPA: heavy metal translocating P-type ATPase, partial [Patescibacteria group bacterium]|nr:heavy metal translocating P-type ATPase [Patescibacteria group bacterium]
MHSNHNSQHGRLDHVEAKMYTCPMHPEVMRDSPGMCPECGMNLIPTKASSKKQGHTGHEMHHGHKVVSMLAKLHGGYKLQAVHDKHAGHITSSFLVKFWISLALTVPIFFYSEMAMMLFDIRGPEFPHWQFVLLKLGTIIYFYGGWIFLSSAYRELKARLPGMMTLIAIAITTAYAYSVFSTLTGSMHDLWFELASLITIMLLGHWIEMKSVQGAQGALKELSKLLPDKAEVIRGNTTEIVSLDQLKVGDVVLVKPGAKIPTDGEIIEGRSDINESIITGESKPIEKHTGDTVIAGSTNGDGSIKVQVTHIGQETFLAGVMRLVADAQASKSRLQMISDRAAFYLTIIAMVCGAITFIAWLLAQAGIVTATERMVAVLVITCPHALGLAIPLVASISTTMAARNGLLVRQRIALEEARKIDTVLFDKTGTLTKGEFGISAIVANTGITENEVLRVAASVNSHSEHPLARAMVQAANTLKLELSEVANFARMPGMGAKGIILGTEVQVGNDSFLKQNTIELTKEYKSKLDNLAKEGKTVIHVIFDTQLLGSIALADIIREESFEAVKKLTDAGIKTAMITGDSEDVAKWVAKELGINEYFAKVMPDKKAEKVKLLQSKGR